MYFSLHSFGQLILTPFGYTDDMPGNNKDIQDIGHRGKDAVAAMYGRNYTLGPVNKVLCKLSLNGYN